MTAAIAIIASRAMAKAHGRNQLNDFGDEGTTGFSLDAGGAGATHADQFSKKGKRQHTNKKGSLLTQPPFFGLVRVPM
jgi:hypothetical protein